MKVRLSCTSYLLPGNSAWEAINKGTELIFGEYGDWPQMLTNNLDEDALCWVIFLEDLIPREVLFSEKQEDILKAKLTVDSALDALRFGLNSNSKKYTFIAWLGWQPDSVLRSARKKTLSFIIAEYITDQLYNLLDKNKRLYLIPLDTLFGEEGYKTCTDSRNFFLSRTRLSQKGIKIFATSLNKLLVRIDKPAVKLLVLDCDNTLWGGVIGENGIGGIKIGQDGLGSAFSAFQLGVKQLAKNGLLLAISSKNEEKDVISVFEKHSSMLLKKDDFITTKIDWRDKSVHIQEIASEIGISIDSIAFWDDNPIEREKVKQSLPGVKVIEPPNEVVEWYDSLRQTDYFASFFNSKEDLEKYSQYKAKNAFEGEIKQFSNYNDFLISTMMEPSIIEINESTIGRAVQLLQKTNQLNLRLKRHDELTLTSIISKSGSSAFLVKLKDKFGDHGIISLVIAHATEESNKAFLDTFLMSCRVLGRNLEGWILDQLRLKLLQHGFVNLEAEYIYGDRNSPAKNLLNDYHFNYFESEEIGGVKSEKYKVDLKSWKIQNLNIFK
jgi:FkbH-like protein